MNDTAFFVQFDLSHYDFQFFLETNRYFDKMNTQLSNLANKEKFTSMENWAHFELLLQSQILLIYNYSSASNKRAGFNKRAWY